MRKLILFIISIVFLIYLTGSTIYKKYDKSKDLVFSTNDIDYYVEVYKEVTSTFIFPIEDVYRISSNVGNRDVIVEGLGGEDGDFHRGIDVVAPEGTPIRASRGGNVYLHYPPPTKYYKGHPVFGGMIVLYHGSGTYTLYGHLSKSYVKLGQFIQRGEVIGVIGNTGISTGTHLHYEIIYNPILLLKE